MATFHRASVYSRRGGPPNPLPPGSGRRYVLLLRTTDLRTSIPLVASDSFQPALADSLLFPSYEESLEPRELRALRL
jgi:hypothetical protein